jgi:hypothetical protein
MNDSFLSPDEVNGSFMASVTKPGGVRCRSVAGRLVAMP